ncbi:MAG: hypothetical protein FJY75_13780 [Candidatus Eisenbacteria bacterium]|uniref:Right handed beta helix domain-containing protein n=1 Tax=Eiseniibacteriota bacterium TaxID=2212470 RepID=A0A937XFF5_UNCEI|nr:hypothetical protein [Candidatus Eisenbacteria bacterium]
MRCWRGSGPTLRNCIFASNASPLFGGAVCCVLDASPLIVGCTFVRNRAGAGGAIACWTDSRPEIRDCLFLENSAASGGAVECADEASLELVGCTFRENQARRGGAVMVRERARARLAACTLCENLAEENGGGVGCETGGAALLERTLIAFGRGGGAIHCGEGGTATLAVCNLFGNEGGDWRGAIAPQYIQRHNLRADPRFCDRPAGDLRLHPDSPCAPGTPLHRGGGLIGAWPVGCEP